MLFNWPSLTRQTQGNTESGEWTSSLLFAAVVCCFGSVVPAGYNIGVINNVMFIARDFIRDSVQTRFSTTLTDNQLTYIWTSIVAIFLIGGVAGSLVAGYLADRYGRKGALIIGNMFGSIGGVLFYTIKSTDAIELFWLARILVGVSGGLATSLVPLYMTELAPINLRGSVGILCQLGLTLGVLFSQLLSLGNILATKYLWHILLSAYIPVCLIAALLTLLLPESPKYLYVVKRNPPLALAELCRLRKRDPSLLQNEIDTLDKEAIASASNEEWSLMKVIKCRELRLPVTLVCILQAGQQLSGINVVFYYSSEIFKDLNLGVQGSQYATLGTGVANVIMALISAKILSKFGRRQPFLWSCYLCMICLFVMFISIILKQMVFMKWMAVVTTISYVFTYGLGLGPIPYFIGSELFDVGPKPTAMALGSMCNWGANFIVAMFFLIVKNYIHAYTFLIFVLCTLFVALFARKHMPETLGKTTAEVTKMMSHGFRSTYPA